MVHWASPPTSVQFRSSKIKLGEKYNVDVSGRRYKVGFIIKVEQYHIRGVIQCASIYK